MVEYRLSPRAQRDLDGVFDYTVTHWGLPQAMRYTDLIEAACTDLAEAPQQAQTVPTSDQAIDGAVSISVLSVSGRPATVSPSSAPCISVWMRLAICKRPDRFA
jgi:plasmid stabilization system protein ParE